MAALGLTLLCASALATDNLTAYPEPEGYYWYSTEPTPEKKSEPEKIPPSPASPAAPAPPTKIDTAWLRERLPKMLDAAIDNPTDANIASYFIAQRVAADMSSRFQDATREFFMFNPEMSEDNRRPSSNFVLNQTHEQRMSDTKEVMADLGSKTGLWAFMSSTCGFCLKQVPALRMLKDSYNLPIVLISMDGNIVPGTEDFDWSFDNGLMAKRYQVQYTPSLFLVDQFNGTSQPLQPGLRSFGNIMQTIAYAARRKGWIDANQFNAMRPVKQYSVLDGSGVIELDADVASDPEQFSEALLQRLQGTPIPGTAPTNSPTQGTF
nr:conjugal transfer protein TraF [Neiella litorisoli]